jgi:spore maturation protein CgeB
VANGVLTLSAHFPDIEQLFTAKQVPTFTDFQSLDQLLVHYLNDDADRRATAKAAHQHAHTHYEATFVAQSMLATLFSEHRH